MFLRPSFSKERLPSKQLPIPNRGTWASRKISNAPYVADFLATAEGLHLNMAFARIHDPKIRKRIVDLVSSLAGEEPGPDARENQNPDEDTTREWNAFALTNTMARMA